MRPKAGTAKHRLRSPSEDICFIIGAGFNQDAAAYGDGTRYPLVTDLAKECFESPVDPDRVEDAFQASLSQQTISGDHPIEKLRRLVMGADWNIAPKLCSLIDDPRNPYGAFVRKFPSADFLSLN